MPAILLVDDHPLFHEGLASALARLAPELQIVSAASAEEGLAVLSREPSIDLALIDLILPDDDGLDVLRTYAAAHPQVPRVLISGRDDATVIRGAREAGASGFLSKSLPAGRLIKALRDLLAGDECFLTPSLVAADGPETQKRSTPELGLTIRQLEVLSLLGEGKPNKEIANVLGIAERTARAHITELFHVLGVSSRTQAVIRAQRLGLLSANREVR